MLSKISFALMERDLVEANRIHYLRESTSKRAIIQSFIALIFIILVVFGLQIAEGNSANHAAVFALTIGALGSGLGICIPILYYVYLGRKTRHLFRQQKFNQGTQDVTLNDGGMQVRSNFGTFAPAWDDYHSWRGGKVGIMLYFDESNFHLIPQRALSSEQLIDIESTLTARGMRKR